MNLDQLADFLQILPLPALVLDLNGNRVEILTPQAEKLFDKMDIVKKTIPDWLRETVHPLESLGGTNRKVIARRDSRTYQVTLRRLPSPNERLVLAVLHELHAMSAGGDFLQDALDAIPNPIFFKDLEGTYLGCNTALCRALGREKDDIVGRTVFDIVPHPRACACEEEDQAVFKTGGQRSYERVLVYPDGSRHDIVFSKTPFFTPSGRMVGLVGIAHDVSERKRAEERIQQLAFYDILTALPNRTLLRDRIGQTIRQCERSGNRFAVFFLGLDAFKAINDDFGHRAGDQLLRAVAGRLSAVVRKSDTLARVGGDEFVGVLPEVQDEEGAATVARKILSALEDPFLLGPHEVPASASIGIALFPSHGRDLDILLKHADAAMYRAKEMGGRRFQFFSGEMTDG